MKMKKHFFMFLILLLLITGCGNDDNEMYIYKINLDQDPYNICGEKIYFSNYEFNGEINMEDIIKKIYDACNIVERK